MHVQASTMALKCNVVMQHRPVKGWTENKTMVLLNAPYIEMFISDVLNFKTPSQKVVNAGEV